MNFKEKEYTNEKTYGKVYNENIITQFCMDMDNELSSIIITNNAFRELYKGEIIQIKIRKHLNILEPTFYMLLYDHMDNNTPFNICLKPEYLVGLQVRVKVLGMKNIRPLEPKNCRHKIFVFKKIN